VLGGLGLHAEGELEGLDARGEGGVGPGEPEVLALEVGEEVELGPLDGAFEGGGEVGDGGLIDGDAAADAGALVDGGEEGVGPVGDAAVAERGVDGDEGGEVGVLGAKAVGDPRAHAGAYLGLRAGVELQQRAAVGLVGAMHGLEDA